MNGNDTLRFEEKNPELQQKYLDLFGLTMDSPEHAKELLQSDGYWKFVEEERI